MSYLHYKWEFFQPQDLRPAWLAHTTLAGQPPEPALYRTHVALFHWHLMEPLSALSIAAAVVQFADFGGGVLKRALDIYKSLSGRSAEDIELVTVSRDLANLVNEVERKDRENRGGVSSNATFIRLCRECRDANGEIQTIIKKLQAHGTSKISRATSSFVVALKKVTTARDLHDLAERMDQLRQQVMAVLLSLLLNEAQKTGLDLRQCAKQQADMIAKLDRHQLNHIFRQLFFETIGNRESDIPKRYTETFEWIFKEPRNSEAGQPLWSSFPRWMEDDGESNRQNLLDDGFFSWNAGMDRLQKTHEGLLRTLLFELVQRKPQLVATVFSARWFLLQSLKDIVLPAMGFDELIAAFQKVLRAAGKNLKLVFLIDGLDEFDEDHEDLIRLLQQASNTPGVKICASSRPWNVFRDVFGKNPMLQLENLTREDIQLYTKKRLELSLGYRDFAVTSPSAAAKILASLVTKAEGVFLWVSVVSNMLESSLREGARTAELLAIVDSLPTQVSDLFRFIWNRTGKQFRAEASQYFQVMRACESLGITLYGLTLWFGDSDISVDMEAAHITKQYLVGVIKTMERGLMSRTGGLLELFDDDGTSSLADIRVCFMHRTASDWVRDNWQSIMSATAIMADFEEWLWILKGEALRLTINTTSLEMYVNSVPTEKLLQVAYLVKNPQPSTLETLVKALERFDRIVSNGLSGYWGNDLTFRESPTAGILVGRKLTAQRADDCHDLLGLAARIPITAYVKRKAEEDVVWFREAALRSCVFECLIYGCHWNNKSTSRLDLLEFLLSLDDGSWTERLWTIREKLKKEDVMNTRFISSKLVNYIIVLIEDHIPPDARPNSAKSRMRHRLKKMLRREQDKTTPVSTGTSKATDAAPPQLPADGDGATAIAGGLMSHLRPAGGTFRTPYAGVGGSKAWCDALDKMLNAVDKIQTDIQQ
ncbi:hypothetical protein QBC43DRAFT_338268 [Cladorrhinum sp. PSN259]|nr:hypothetical protein QBC43DRAFT_338268 [Cladorrhinum sp. PSN259]